MAASKRLRYEVMRRDNHACRYCGGTAPDVKLTIDHVVPTTLGGKDEAENLVTACADCNAGKSSVPADASLVADVAADAWRWGKAMAAAADARRVLWAEQEQILDEFTELWEDWTYGPEHNRKYLPRPLGWQDSIFRFIEAGLDVVPDLQHCIGIAGRSKASPDDTWRYFCGVAWSEIRRRQEIAQEVVGLVEDEAGG